MAKTIKNTKTKQKSTKSQKPTLKQDVKTIVDVLYTHRKAITRLKENEDKIIKAVSTDFKYLEDMRKIQDEYIDSNFKAIRWLYAILCAITVVLSVGMIIRKNKLETRLTQLEATYEISRRD